MTDAWQLGTGHWPLSTGPRPGFNPLFIREKLQALPDTIDDAVALIRFNPLFIREKLQAYLVNGKGEIELGQVSIPYSSGKNCKSAITPNPTDGPSRCSFNPLFIREKLQVFVGWSREDREKISFNPLFIREKLQGLDTYVDVSGFDAQFQSLIHQGKIASLWFPKRAKFFFNSFNPLFIREKLQDSLYAHSGRANISGKVSIPYSSGKNCKDIPTGRGRAGRCCVSIPYSSGKNCKTRREL